MNEIEIRKFMRKIANLMYVSFALWIVIVFHYFIPNCVFSLYHFIFSFTIYVYIMTLFCILIIAYEQLVIHRYFRRRREPPLSA